jgi:hypothetical protein
MTRIFDKSNPNPLNVEDYLKKEAPGLVYDVDWKSSVSFEDFKYWLEKTSLKVMYKKIKIFREVWLHNDGDWKNRHYKWILKCITGEFLQHHAYRTFIKKALYKRFFDNNLMSYLDQLPNIMRAYEQPENFFSIKDFP